MDKSIHTYRHTHKRTHTHHQRHTYTHSHAICSQLVNILRDIHTYNTHAQTKFNIKLNNNIYEINRTICIIITNKQSQGQRIPASIHLEKYTQHAIVERSMRDRLTALRWLR